jgi:DNA-binding NarL/FixJ family response regulator
MGVHLAYRIIITTPMKRIALIEDDELLLKRMTAFLNAQSDLECVLCANSLGQFFELLGEESHIDLLLADVELGENINSLDHLQKVAALLPTVKILVITGHNHPDYIRRALQKGASGFFLKGSSPQKLLEAIEMAGRGAHYLAPEAASHIVPLLQEEEAPQLSASKLDAVTDMVALLSRREKQVAIRLVDGYSYQEIADEIFVSINTVRHYVKVLYEKFDVSNKMQFSNKVRHSLAKLQPS